MGNHQHYYEIQVVKKGDCTCSISSCNFHKKHLALIFKSYTPANTLLPPFTYPAKSPSDFSSTKKKEHLFVPHNKYTTKLYRIRQAFVLVASCYLQETSISKRSPYSFEDSSFFFFFVSKFNFLLYPLLIRDTITLKSSPPNVSMCHPINRLKVLNNYHTNKNKVNKRNINLGSKSS